MQQLTDDVIYKLIAALRARHQRRFGHSPDDAMTQGHAWINHWRDHAPLVPEEAAAFTHQLITELEAIPLGLFPVDVFRRLVIKDLRGLLDQQSPSPLPNPAPLPPPIAITDARAKVLPFPSREDDDEEAQPDPPPVAEPMRLRLDRSYYATPYWRRLRAWFCRWWEHKCALCGRKDRPIEVHHNDYAHLWNERFHDCIPLCDECHAQFHGRLPKIPVLFEKKAA